MEKLRLEELHNFTRVTQLISDWAVVRVQVCPSPEPFIFHSPVMTAG